MTTHWIIAIGSAKLPVMSGKAILTEVSSGTTEMPSPTSTRRSRGRAVAGNPAAADAGAVLVSGRDAVAAARPRGRVSPKRRPIAPQHDRACREGQQIHPRAAPGRYRGYVIAGRIVYTASTKANFGQFEDADPERVRANRRDGCAGWASRRPCGRAAKPEPGADLGRHGQDRR